MLPCGNNLKVRLNWLVSIRHVPQRNWSESENCFFLNAISGTTTDATGLVTTYAHELQHFVEDVIFAYTALFRARAFSIR